MLELMTPRDRLVAMLSSEPTARGMTTATVAARMRWNLARAMRELVAAEREGRVERVPTRLDQNRWKSVTVEKVDPRPARYAYL